MLATRTGTDMPSGPGTLVYRSWSQVDHVAIELLWRTFADTIDARRGVLEGCALKHDDTQMATDIATDVLVRVETNGKLDAQQRLIPLTRLQCVRIQGGAMLLGDDPAALDHGLLLAAARRWLHSTASDERVLAKHASAFDALAIELQADSTTKQAAIDEAVNSAKHPDDARTRSQAVG
jgi:hypothetical protein